MALYPLSDITVANISNELASNALFSARSTAEKLQLINSAQQEIADLYIDAESNQYKDNTLELATLLSTIQALLGNTKGIRPGVETIGATPTTYYFSGALPSYCTYFVLGVGVKNGITYGVDALPENVTRDGFVASTSEEGVTFYYLGVAL
jgi:hypothetical protein